MSGWTTADMPRLDGRRAVVTGANSGIGLVAARELARNGASVILACRNTQKGEEAARDIPGEHEVRALDLADLKSIRAFAEQLEGDVDILINNAGVMAVPLTRTADGFEMQIGTNHLGHFALTGLLLPRLKDRVVTISSGAHKMGRINFKDLQSERSYQRWMAYGQSKLANLLFMRELQRRFDAAGLPLRSTAAHPGWSATNLQFHTQTFQDKVMGLMNHVIAQSAESGALCTLYAATQDIPGGSYVGPDGPAEMRGSPKLVGMSGRASDPEAAARLWEISERATGVSYDFSAVPAAVT